MKGVSTYLGAAPIVECLEKYQADVIITSRVADAALFLAPMVCNLIPFYQFYSSSMSSFSRNAMKCIVVTLYLLLDQYILILI